MEVLIKCPKNMHLMAWLRHTVSAAGPHLAAATEVNKQQLWDARCVIGDILRMVPELVVEDLSEDDYRTMRSILKTVMAEITSQPGGACRFVRV